MKNKTIVAIASGLTLAGLAFIFRKKIQELFSREEEEDFFDGRSTYSINELLPDDSNPFDKMREKLKTRG